VARGSAKGRGGAGRNEAAAAEAVLDVWEFVWEHADRLKRWHPEPETLFPLLSGLVLTHIRRFRQKCRRHRQAPLPSWLIDQRGSEADTVVPIEELRTYLSPAQRAYTDAFLLGTPKAAIACPISRAAERKMEERIRDKIRRLG